MVFPIKTNLGELPNLSIGLSPLQIGANSILMALPLEILVLQGREVSFAIVKETGLKDISDILDLVLACLQNYGLLQMVLTWLPDWKLLIWK